MTTNQPIQLGEKFEQALEFALHIHRGQTRKGSQTPYFAHILGVASLVLEDGGSEIEAIAALLHDAAEDGAGQQTLDQIRVQFGEEIAGIVLDCSDTLETPKPPWRARKQAHIDHLENSRPESIRVKLADKVHNANNLLRSLHEHGPSVWDDFKGGRAGTLWYFKEMYAVFSQTRAGYLMDEFARLIEKIDGYPEG
ncbi:MAG: HD domain-containing protein [Anaerolineales bacterium]|nr:HD domain-containing protein [Anaerolineales bacterium]